MLAKAKKKPAIVRMYREFLRLAALLAASSDGNPQWVSRNRAVSTAYYALFHALAELCARELAGAWSTGRPFQHIYRSLDHGQARKVLRAATGDRSYGQDAGRLAEIFGDLQAQRHRADYDPFFRVSTSETYNIIGRAEIGIALIFALPPHERRLMAAQLIGRARD